SDLLSRAENRLQHPFPFKDDLVEPLPVVLNLASWVAARPTMAQWLVSEISALYDIPRRLARTWIAADDLVLLLDGLDEIPSQYQDILVDRINEFRENHRLSSDN